MADVIPFPGPTKAEIIENALPESIDRAGIQHCIVLAVMKNGTYYFVSSTDDDATKDWLIDILQQELEE